MLTIRDLQTPLLGPINLQIESGECVAIAGPSGAGKSLLLRAIADLDENIGTVALAGTNRESYQAPMWRKKVAYVPAESGWWSEDVADHFANTPNPTALLNALNLSNALSWQVSRLSTGERQRLALARALQLDPKVLLLDEPTSALDPVSVECVETLLKTKASAGCMLLIVSHDPAQPTRFGARRLFMNEGKLHENPGPDAGVVP